MAYSAHINKSIYNLLFLKAGFVRLTNGELMGRVLITGGLGFIGSNLSHFLLTNSDDTIIIYDNVSRKDVLKNKEWLEQTHRNNSRLHIVLGDISDFEKLKANMVDVEKIYHIAGQVAVTSSVEDPFLDFETNAKGTLNLLECAKQLKTDPYLILTSTNKVYGELKAFKVHEEDTRYEFDKFKQGIDENTLVDPHSPYGCSKFCADAYFKDYYRIYGLKTVVFRMSCIYGYRQFGNEDQGWVTHFIISSVLNRNLTIYGDGKQVRDILFIEDLIQAFQLAFDNITNTKGKIYNIGGGPKNTISLLEFIKLLEEFLSNKIRYEVGNWRPGDQKVYYSNINKALKDFNWKPRISKEEGIQKLLLWIKENAQLFK